MHIIQKGTPITSGIAVGKAFVIGKKAAKPHSLIITEDQIPYELERLKVSVAKTREQMQNALVKTDLNHSSEIQGILTAYLAVLDDRIFINTIEKEIIQGKLSSEAALTAKLDNLRLEFDGAEDIKRKMLLSFQDIYYRIYYNLSVDSVDILKDAFQGLTEPVILVAYRLSPLIIANLPPQKLLGIIIENTTISSHSVIIAQSLRLPVLIDIVAISSIVHEGDQLIIDCYKGVAIINPNKDELNRYESGRVVAPIKSKWREMPKTKDGVTIKIEANIVSLADAIDVQKQGVSNIGLFRSELFYLGFQHMPSIEEESSFYKSIFNQGFDRIDIRLLDIGADKKLPYFDTAEEQNPTLGIRGIRLLLSNRYLLKKQITSIYDASTRGDVRILLPFVSSKEEIYTIKKISANIAEEKKLRLLPIGLMAEIPSTMLCLDEFLDDVDFVSIGTNDLIQFLFAADRHNSDLKTFSKYDHPLHLKILARGIIQANKHNKEIKVCGEMASELKGAALLIGAGMKVLSVQPDVIDKIGTFITSHKYEDFRTFFKLSLNYNESEHDKYWQKLFMSK